MLFSRQIVARFSQDCRATVARPSCDTRATFVRVSRKFRIVNSPKFRGDKFATLARTSRDRRTTVARQSCEIFWRKKSHKIFQHVEKLRDQFATSSRHKKFSRHSRDTRTNVVRKSRDTIRKTVARNSHASEILALGC